MSYSDATATTLRARITTSLRSRVQARLQDSGASRWSTDDLDEAIRTALQQYTLKSPAHAIGTVELAAAGREIDVSSLTGLLRVEKVWWDYDSETPGYPPNWRQFEVWPGAILYIDDPEEPASGETIRVWYTKSHTVNGLDSANATTVPEEDIEIIVTGAAYFAAQQRALELAESLNVDKDVVARIREWADDQGKNFRYNVNLKPPAWQRYAYAYDQDDIDEAIRWAMQRYDEVHPDEAIATLTLEADGREVDISSIAGYLEITRAWWNYDSSSPSYPPDWRDFELWPGDILFVKDGDEPAAGDVVRVWYTQPHTLYGLDSATATTIPADAETLIVTGAAGFAAEERVQEQPQSYVPRKLRDWAENRIREFERGLKLVGRRQAARHSGVASGPVLDRFDGDGWR